MARKVTIDGNIIGTKADKVEYSNSGMSGVTNAKAALDNLQTRIANVEQSGGGGSTPSGGNIPFYRQQYYLNNSGEEQLAYNHNLFKLAGTGKSVRITTKSNDNQLHPLAILFKENDGGTDVAVKQVLFPLKDATLRTYTLDINIEEGCYVLVSAWKTETPSYVYIDTIADEDSLRRDAMLRNEAVSRSRLANIGSIKAVMLDCGRKYFSVANIKAFIDYCKADGLNTLELHFSENEGFRFALDDMTIVAGGEEYDLADALGPGITWTYGTPDTSDDYLSESDMDEIIAYADTQGIRIVPSLDMPGHLGAILDTFPEFKLGDRDFNFLAQQGREFLFAMLEKYAAYFSGKGCKFFNVCCDEFGTNFDDKYQRVADLMNDFADIIVKNGMIPMAFNDFFGRGVEICKGYVVDYWMHYEAAGYVHASVLEGLGYEIVNSSKSIYYSLGNTDDLVFPSGFDVHDGNSFSPISNPKGAMLCLWCDKGNTDGEDGGTAMVTRLQPYIAAYGVAMQKGLFAGEIRFVNGIPQMWNGNGWSIAAGGSWLSLGTSITWYNDNHNGNITKGYQECVMERINFTSFTNKGVNGACMAGSGGLGATASSTVIAADYVTIEHGVNDWGNGMPVGTMSDFTNDTGAGTFYGAYRKVIDAVYSKRSSAKIILCTPRKAYGFNSFLPSHWYDAKNGIYLKDYADAVIEIAKFMSLPVCDWFNEGEANQNNLASLSIDTALHPNDAGHQRMADLLVQTFMKVM